MYLKHDIAHIFGRQKLIWACNPNYSTIRKKFFLSSRTVLGSDVKVIVQIHLYRDILQNVCRIKLIVTCTPMYNVPTMGIKIRPWLSWLKVKVTLPMPIYTNSWSLVFRIESMFEPYITYQSTIEA